MYLPVVPLATAAKCSFPQFDFIFIQMGGKWRVVGGGRLRAMEQGLEHEITKDKRRYRYRY